jgi:hypothetical protein
MMSAVYKTQLPYPMNKCLVTDKAQDLMAEHVIMCCLVRPIMHLMGW